MNFIKQTKECGNEESSRAHLTDYIYGQHTYICICNYDQKHEKIYMVKEKRNLKRIEAENFITNVYNFYYKFKKTLICNIKMEHNQIKKICHIVNGIIRIKILDI